MTEEKLRAQEFAICKKRGHQPSSIMLPSNPPQNICKWCGTHYRYEQTLIERNFPEEK